MIVCYIDGAAAYPSTSSSIKVTFENAAVKDRESRTQELTFNLGIADNRKVFGAVNRIDVKKSAATFAACRLYADNLLVIEGEGTITSYSDTEVKLQIKTATAASQFPDSFSAKYIDTFTDFLSESDIVFEKNLQESDGYVTNQAIVSQPLLPVYDEANSRWLNCPCWYSFGLTKAIEHYAPQPKLKDVVARIVYALGYREKGGERLVASGLSPIAFFEQEPWSKLRVLNVNPSIRYRNMLPHWTAAKFFTELSNLFNLTLLFDEKTQTVTVAQGLTVSSDETHYDCLDEFTSDYDEDGESLLASSNLAYNVSDSENWDGETLSQEVVAQFPLDDYPNESNALINANAMSDEEKLTRIFRTDESLFYFTHTYDEDGNATGTNGLVFATLGNLVRQPESEETLDLNIAPACIAPLDVEVKIYDNVLGATYETVGTAQAYVPSTPEGKTMITDGTESYVTVENVVDGTDSEKTDEQERMEIYFADDGDVTHLQTSVAVCSFDIINCHTASRDRFRLKTYDSSLSLCDTKTEKSVANLHSQTARIDNHDTIVIKFEADDLPDPRKTYVFRGKRFLCDKIELEITADGISKIKTGYFFEMQ